jgi:hypothetical protein
VSVAAIAILIALVLVYVFAAAQRSAKKKCPHCGRPGGRSGSLDHKTGWTDYHCDFCGKEVSP